MKNIFLAAILTAKTAFSANASFAETFSLHNVTPCIETEDAISNLSKNHQETPLATGVGTVQYFDNQQQIETNAGMFTFWVNQDAGTFTVTMSFQDGITCLLTEGNNFEPYTGDISQFVD